DGPPLVQLWGRRATSHDGETRMQHWLQVGELPGAVVIARSQARMLFVSVRRPAVGQGLLELPRGFGEAEDGPAGAVATVQATALRELREETGVQGVRPRILGSYVLDSAVYPAVVWAVACDVDADIAAVPS